MAGPLESVKALWKDPKKRPWLIGGTGVAVGAGFLAMRRQQESAAAEAAAEGDPAAALEGDPTALEAATTGDPAAAGGLPALVYVGGDGQGGDPAFSEMDLSGVFGEIDALRGETEAAIDDAVREGTGGLRAKSRQQGQRLKRAEAKNKRQQQQLARQRKKTRTLQKRVKRVERRTGPKSKAKGKPKRKGGRKPRARVRR